MQQTLATPDANNPHTLGITTVHDAEWRMDEFPQERLIEFGHNTTHIGMLGQCLDALEHFRHQSIPDLGHSLLRVPTLYLLEIADCGFSQADDRPWHGAISGRVSPWPRRRKSRALYPGPPDPQRPPA